MDEWLTQVVAAAVPLAAIVAMLMAAVKTAAGDKLPARYYPLLSVCVLGPVVGYAVARVSGLIALDAAIITGVLAGGIASGLFSWGKSKEQEPVPH